MARGRYRRCAGALGLAACLLLVVSSTATAQNLEVGLADAEAKAAAVAAEVAELEAGVQPAKSSLEAAQKRAAPIRIQAKRAAERVGATEASLRRGHQRAVAAVNRIEGERSDAADEHNRKVRSGAGLAIAALIIAAIAIAWGWFRASAAVAYLARIQLGQAIGLCVGSGLVAIFSGAAISSAGGFVGVIGVTILSLGFMLPVALLLGRHSAEVQRGSAKPLLRRDRLPIFVTQAIAGLFALLFFIGLGSALFAGEVKSGKITPRMREQAEGRGAPSPGLARAEDAATKFEERAAPLIASVEQRQSALRAAERNLANAEAQLASVEGNARGFTQRLAAVEKREAREHEKEERKAQRLAEEEQHELEEVEEENAELTSCDPNYEGECLTLGIGDYDCAGGSGDGPNYVYSPVTVVGVDVYGLDANNNGIGCETE